MTLSPRPGRMLPRGAAIPLSSSLIPVVPTCPGLSQCPLHRSVPVTQTGIALERHQRRRTARHTCGTPGPVPPHEPCPRVTPAADVRPVEAAEHRSRRAGPLSPGRSRSVSLGRAQPAAASFYLPRFRDSTCYIGSNFKASKYTTSKRKSS